LRQFFLETPEGQAPQPGQTVVLDSEESHHLFTVLRGGRDLVLQLTDGRGRRFTARAAGGDRRSAQVEILTVTEDSAENEAPLLELACAVVKGKRFEWALEKAVELGAHRIVPLVTERGVIEPGSGKRNRSLTILRSALKQCGRCRLPDLDASLRLDEYLARPVQGMKLFGAVPGEVADTVPWSSLLNPVPSPVPGILSMVIGPEGGWTSPEIEGLLSTGAVPVQLGPHVLRTETAAAAGLTALQALRGRWATS
jgi:16S rRNA (uracil1498-N3)-methyltransferase